MPSPRRRGGIVEDTSLGVPLILLLVWLAYEFGRPPAQLIFKVPLLISIVSVGLWLRRSDKQLGATGNWWFAMLAGMLIMVPLSLNNFSAYGLTRGMFILFLSICLPLQSLVKNLGHARAWAYTFLAVATYVGIWATMNAGYARGGQDENYAAALMGMALPFAYFSLASSKRAVVKLVFGSMIVIFIAAMALAGNASRGGFLALCCLGAYIVIRSPRKNVAIGALGLAAVALLVVAGPSFWAEIQTTGEFETGTGDLRLRAWKGGVRMFFAYPLLGVGPGNFSWQLGNFESAAEVMSLGRSMAGAMVAHSTWVELMAELGLFGMLCTFMLGKGAWMNLEHVQKRAERLSHGRPDGHAFVELRGLALATQGGLLALSVNGIFLSLLYYPHIWLLIAFANALPFVLADLERRQAPGMGVPSAAPAPGRGRRRGRGVPAARQPAPQSQPLRQMRRRS